MSAVKVVPVVGVSFTATYPDNLLRLAAVLDELPKDESLAVILRRNPQNEYDANAVEVHVPDLGELAMIGHLSRDNAERVAPLMDGGIEFSSWIAQTRVNPDHRDRPGIDIAIRRAVTS